MGETRRSSPSGSKMSQDVRKFCRHFLNQLDKDRILYVAANIMRANITLFWRDVVSEIGDFMFAQLDALATKSAPCMLPAMSAMGVVRLLTSRIAGLQARFVYSILSRILPDQTTSADSNQATCPSIIGQPSDAAEETHGLSVQCLLTAILLCSNCLPGAFLDSLLHDLTTRPAGPWVFLLELASILHFLKDDDPALQRAYALLRKAAIRKLHNATSDGSECRQLSLLSRIKSEAFTETRIALELRSHPRLRQILCKQFFDAFFAFAVDQDSEAPSLAGFLNYCESTAACDIEREPETKNLDRSPPESDSDWLMMVSRITNASLASLEDAGLSIDSSVFVHLLRERLLPQHLMNTFREHVQSNTRAHESLAIGPRLEGRQLERPYQPDKVRLSLQSSLTVEEATHKLMKHLQRRELSPGDLIQNLIDPLRNQPRSTPDFAEKVFVRLLTLQILNRTFGADIIHEALLYIQRFLVDILKQSNPQPLRNIAHLHWMLFDLLTSADQIEHWHNTRASGYVNFAVSLIDLSPEESNPATRAYLRFFLDNSTSVSQFESRILDIDNWDRLLAIREKNISFTKKLMGAFSLTKLRDVLLRRELEKIVKESVN